MYIPKAGDPKEVMDRNLTALREYAASAIHRGELLAPGAEADKDTRMRELMSAAESFSLTEREIVGIICRGLFDRNSDCTCRPCSSRRQA